jgi:allantoinase
MTSFVIRSERVAHGGGMHPATIHVTDGVIAAVGRHDDRPAGVPEIDAGTNVVMPGLVDTHVHINDPGRAEWEGFEHATRAAAAGGVTTLVDMPLNSIPATTSVEALEAKRSAAQGRCYVDVGFWGGVVPDNVADLEPLARAGVLGYKAFLSPSGVDEFSHVTQDDLLAAAPVLARQGLPLLVHAELPALLREPSSGDPRRYTTWLETRPPEAEAGAIDWLANLASTTGVHVHIVHLASWEPIQRIREARAAGASISVETCPHYLTFAAEEIADGATAFKCAPPIRSRNDREFLWMGLIEGHIDLIATDHSPSLPALKRLDDGDFLRAWGGIASLQLSLAAVWTGAAARGIEMGSLARWLCAAPATLAGVSQRKGEIAVGRDADFVIWDPETGFTVDAALLQHRHPVTPYAGRRLRGRVLKTILRGQLVFDEGTFSGPLGTLLRRQLH